MLASQEGASTKTMLRSNGFLSFVKVGCSDVDSYVQYKQKTLGKKRDVKQRPCSQKLKLKGAALVINASISQNRFRSKGKRAKFDNHCRDF